MKQSLAVVLSYDPRFDTIDVVFVEEPLSDQSEPFDQIYGLASPCLGLASSWLIDWLQRNRREAAGSP